MIDLQKRPIGVEDIAWDTAGNGGKDTYTAPGGNVIEVHKINASHISVSTTTAALFNSSNLDAILRELNTKINDNTSSSGSNNGLSSNVTVNIGNEDSGDTIQTTINAQKKNLNGYTLTFVFPGALTFGLFNTLYWRNFYNGQIKIISSLDNAPAQIKDETTLSALFCFENCSAVIGLNKIDFIQNTTPYAIKAVNCSAVIAMNGAFSGTGGNSACMLLDTSLGNMISCQWENNDKFHFAGCLKDLVGSEGQPAVSYLPLAGGTMTGAIVSANGLLAESPNGVSKITIRGGDALDPGAQLTLYGASHTLNAGMVELVASDGTDSATLTLSPDGTLAIEGSSIILGYPNYAAGVFSTGTSYTAPGNGWLYMQVSGDEVLPHYYINGYEVGYFGSGHYNHSSVFVPVKKGDVATMKHGDTNESGNFIFYPNR